MKLDLHRVPPCCLEQRFELLEDRTGDCTGDTALAAVVALLQDLVIKLHLLGRRRQAPLEPPFEGVYSLLAGLNAESVSSR